MFKIKNIDHIVLTTQNLQKCLDFYQNILNMQLNSSNGRYASKLWHQIITSVDSFKKPKKMTEPSTQPN